MECFAYENDLAFKGLSFEPKYLSTVNPKKMTADVKIHLTKDGVPQKSLSVWAILRTNANSFRSVLLSAIRSSGINKNLSNRKLAVIRFIDTPSGKVTQQKWEEFLDLGGIEIRPQNDCIKLLFAINTIRAKYPKKFPLWARKRSPTKGAGRLREVMHDLFGV
jgi:hypothetical protein